MSRGPQTSRQLAAALKAMAAAGIMVCRVEIDPASGKIVIVTSTGTAKDSTSELDKWLTRHAC